MLSELTLELMSQMRLAWGQLSIAGAVHRGVGYASGPVASSYPRRHRRPPNSVRYPGGLPLL